MSKRYNDYLLAEQERKEQREQELHEKNQDAEGKEKSLDANAFEAAIQPHEGSHAPVEKENRGLRDAAAHVQRRVTSC